MQKCLCEIVALNVWSYNHTGLKGEDGKIKKDYPVTFLSFPPHFLPLTYLLLKFSVVLCLKKVKNNLVDEVRLDKWPHKVGPFETSVNFMQRQNAIVKIP